MRDSHHRVLLDTALPHRYRITSEPPPQTISREYGSHAGSRIYVQPADADPFAISLPASDDRIALSTWPHPEFFLVLDTAELIDTTAPHNTVRLAALEGHAIHYHMLLPKHELALLGSCNGLFCYGATGLQWTIDLKYCGRRPILDFYEDTLIMLAHDTESECLRRHTFDITSGDWLGESAVL